MKLVFASNNKHKLEEVRQILTSDVAVVSLKDIGFLHEIDETGETLEENSALKAREVWQWLLQNGLSNDVDGVFAFFGGVFAVVGKAAKNEARF